MKTSDKLTALGNWFAEDRWIRGALWDSEQFGDDCIKNATKGCLVGGYIKLFGWGITAWFDNATEAALQVAVRRRGFKIATPVGWSEGYCRDSQDAANLCHEAALIAKQGDD